MSDHNFLHEIDPLCCHARLHKSLHYTFQPFEKCTKVIKNCLYYIIFIYFIYNTLTLTVVLYIFFFFEKY